MPEAGKPPAGPVRVLFLITQLGLGGSEKQLVDLIRNLDHSRVEPAVLAFKGGDAREATLAEVRVPYFVVPASGRPRMERLRTIRRLVREQRIQVVQAFDPISSLYASLSRGAPSSCTIIAGYYTYAMPAFRLWLGFLLLRHRMDYVVCNSHPGASYLFRRCGIPRSRIVIIPNGLDTAAMESHRVSGAPLREQLGLPPGTPLIGMVGKLNRDKNPEILVEAARIVHARFPRVAFCLVGSGPLEGRVKELLVEHRMNPYFHLVPSRPDGPWVSKEFDIGVLCSRVEGLPNVLLEYMYWGKPVVATRVGDCGEVVEHGRTGRVVPPGDPPAFAEALCALLDDPVAAGDLGRAGRERLETYYRFERYLEEITGLLLSAAPRTPREA